MMRIYLDDERQTPEGWVRAYTVPELINLFILHGTNIEEISLDHDLGDGQQTGYDFLRWLEEKVYNQELSTLPIIKIHSANPVGRRNMELTLLSMEKGLENALSE